MTKLLEPNLVPIVDGSVSPEQAIADAQYALGQHDSDPCWAIPLAFSYWQLNQYDQAYAVSAQYKSRLQSNPDFLLLFGMIARKLPECELEAEAAFKAAIELQPFRHDAYYNLGNLYYAQERFEEAIIEYRSSLELNAEFATCWLNLGLASRTIDQLELSAYALKNSIRLEPQSIRAWCNYGITCHQLERFDSAIRSYKHALSLDENHGASLVNLAMSLNASNRHSESLEYLQAASSMTLQEDCGDSLFNLALTKLLLGDYLDGWRLYECRFKTRQYADYKRIPAGEWIHSPSRLVDLGIENREVVVWSEQGLGDAIQFIRYLPLLQEFGLTPVLATRPLLVRLFREWFDFPCQVINDIDVDLSDDMRPHVAMMSLPYLLGTTLTTIPSCAPYLYPPGPAPEALLIPNAPGSLSVGIVWASNPDNKLMYRRKSLPLRQLLAPLYTALREDLIVFHSLQVGDDAEALTEFSDCSNVHCWNGRLSDFADTAHVVRQLDLVITVDTGVAHLAGALGVPTWLLLHYDSDFRWLRECDSSPWYPGMRIFRQQSYGDWNTALIPMFDELSRIYGLDLSSLQ